MLTDQNDLLSSFMARRPNREGSSLARPCGHLAPNRLIALCCAVQLGSSVRGHKAGWPRGSCADSAPVFYSLTSECISFQRSDQQSDRVKKVAQSTSELWQPHVLSHGPSLALTWAICQPATSLKNRITASVVPRISVWVSESLVAQSYIAFHWIF